MRKRLEKGGRQPFAEHLMELRGRLAYCLLSLVIGTGVSYYYRDLLLSLLLKPLNQPVFYTSPTGGFDFLLKACMFFGFILSVPVCIYHLLRFLEPIMEKPLQNRILLLLLASWGLVGVGILFAYKVSLPATLHFLGGFTNEEVRSLISTNEYFSFILIYLAGFAVIFQLPLIMMFINSVTRLSVRSLISQGRLVIVLAFTAAAIITPTPDPLNQTIMAMPILLLYAMSVGIIAFVNRNPAKKEKRRRMPPPPPPPPLPPRFINDLRRSTVVAPQ